MTDRYLKFANRPIGRRIVKTLGLPDPLLLERFDANHQALKGPVLIGATDDAELLEYLASSLKSIDTQTLAHDSASIWMTVARAAGLISGRWTGPNGTAGEKCKALIFDATGLSDSTQTIALHQFFRDCARSLLPCGRVVVLGRPPESCADYRNATVQRSLEGLTRSLGKELRRGTTVQLVYVEKGAEPNVESTLRFLLSPRSAYVSGQVIRIGAAVGELNLPTDWNRSLSGKKVLVTGASRGIGEAIADTMAREGAKLTLLDTQQAQSRLEAVAETSGAAILTMDIGAEDAPSKLVEAASAADRWDVVVHNAGITRDKRIANMKADVWQQVVNVNLSTQERINEALLKSNALNSNGRIVCVSSISGIAGNIGQTNYALSKAGVIGMVQSTAPMFAAKGMTINAVAPGFIETQMTARIPFAIREAGRRMNSLSQGGLPVDVAEAVVWLANPASSGVNGNVVRVCGQSLLGA